MALTVCPAIQKHVLFKPTAIKSSSLGHHAQMDVKFLSPLTFKGKKIRRFQYTTIDDATRIRALKIYHKHTQQNAIDFVDYVPSKFPFRIQTIRTDNGHAFQAKFHWQGKS